MKYTKEERLDIGRRIYAGELSRYQAAEAFGISDQTARDYMRLYRDTNQLPAKRGMKWSCQDLFSPRMQGFLQTAALPPCLPRCIRLGAGQGRR